MQADNASMVIFLKSSCMQASDVRQSWRHLGSTAMMFCHAGWFTAAAWEKITRQVNNRFKQLVEAAANQQAVAALPAALGSTDQAAPMETEQ